MRIYYKILIILFSVILSLFLYQIVPSVLHIHFIRKIWDKPYLQCVLHQKEEALSISQHPLYLTFSLHGRLGNWMFAYASLLGIAFRNNRKPFISGSSSLSAIFKLQHTLSWQPVCMDDFHEKYPCKYDSRTENIPQVNLTLREYFQSWKYFQDYESEVRKEFTFLPDLHAEAKDIFLKYKGNNSNSTLVISVHVRRTDMMIKSSTKHGFKSAPLEYINNAMNYMRGKFSREVVKFLVLSDDYVWCSTHLTESDTVVIPQNHQFIDIAILSMCNHSIVTTGTYGWWGAWLAGGHTVYYKNFPEPGSRLDHDFNHGDFYPPSWVAMDTGTQTHQLLTFNLVISLLLLIMIL